MGVFRRTMWLRPTSRSSATRTKRSHRPLWTIMCPRMRSRSKPAFHTSGFLINRCRALVLQSCRTPTSTTRRETKRLRLLVPTQPTPRMHLPIVRSSLRRSLTLVCAMVCSFLAMSSLRAADHGDAPSLAHDQGADVADLYLFLDPTDNTQVVLIATFRGFIVPGEAVNFAIFDPALRYRFEIFTEHVNLPADQVNAKKIKANRAIDVTFSQRTASSPQDTAAGKGILQVAQPQTATV